MMLTLCNTTLSIININMIIYRSKTDHWLWIVITIIYIGCFIPVIIDSNQSLKLYLLLIAPNIIPIFLIINIYTNTYYTIDDDKLSLRVKSGILLNNNYSINKITKIRNTRTWLSSPALSLDRIELTVGKYNKVVISPQNKTQFINHLKELNPDIIVEV